MVSLSICVAVVCAGVCELLLRGPWERVRCQGYRCPGNHDNDSTQYLGSKLTCWSIESHPRHLEKCLPWVCCVALPCCLFDLPSFSSLNNMYIIIYWPFLPQTIRPLVVATNMSDMPTSFFIPTPAVFARSVLNTVGILSVTPGYYPHVLQVYIVQLHSSLFVCMYMPPTYVSHCVYPHCISLLVQF